MWLPRNHGFQLSLRVCFQEVRQRSPNRMRMFKRHLSSRRLTERS